MTPLITSTPGMPRLNEMEDDYKDFTEKEKNGLRNFYETSCYPCTLRPASQPYLAGDDDHWPDMIAAIEMLTKLPRSVSSNSSTIVRPRCAHRPRRPAKSLYPL